MREPTGRTAEPAAWQVFWIFLRLGLTSFGGPVAHLGYFHAEFVARRRWLSDRAYADIVALCQFLPGPASSQVGMALGLRRAGFAGALAAWLGFTLPSALVMALLGMGLASGQVALPAGAVHGLKLAAAAVVAQAVWAMARSLCRGPARQALALMACGLALWQPGMAGQGAAMLSAAALGVLLWGRDAPRALMPEDADETPTKSRRAGTALLVLCLALFLLLPIAARTWPQGWVALADALYRTGALVFGGGHVVLPLLQAETVGRGWVSANDFVAGYGAAQAVPGPLFTFASFLGAAAGQGVGGWPGAVVATVAIFLPGFLLVAGVLPFWAHWRGGPRVRAALSGVNAAVVGLLLAALYDPLGRSAIHGLGDVAVAGSAAVALMALRAPAWLVVLLCGAGGWALALHGN